MLTSPTEIAASRWKAVLYLAGCLIFVVIGLLALTQAKEVDVGAELGLAFFGLGAVVFAWMLIRPQRLLLDHEGFTLVGGLVRSPKKVFWTDIDPFFVYRLPRGGKMIGYNYRPGVRAERPLAKLTRWLGADAALPKGWPKSPEKMVEDLNGYRARAVGGPVAHNVRYGSGIQTLVT